MRPRERVVEPPAPPAPPESQSPAPEPRTVVSPSSIPPINNPPVSSGGIHLDPRNSADNLRHAPPPPLRRHDSPQDLRRREHLAPKDAFFPSVSHSDLHRRRSPLILPRRRSPSPPHPRSQRFRDAPGSSCTPRRPRVNDGFNESDFHHPGGLRSGCEMQRGRDGSRAPPDLGRVSRPDLRGSNSSVCAMSPSERDYIHRNDPNLSPREGDWICLNPYCGNLNFARQTFCKNCHKNRYDNPCRSSRSTRRGDVNPPPPVDYGPQGDLIRYRSPPDDPRDSRIGLIPPRHGTVRSNRLQFREDDFRELDPRRLSPDDQRIRDNRDRSRSPISGGLPRDSFPGRS